MGKFSRRLKKSHGVSNVVLKPLKTEKILMCRKKTKIEKLEKVSEGWEKIGKAWIFFLNHRKTKKIKKKWLVPKIDNCVGKNIGKLQKKFLFRKKLEMIEN